MKRLHALLNQLEQLLETLGLKEAVVFPEEAYIIDAHDCILFLRNLFDVDRTAEWTKEHGDE